MKILINIIFSSILFLSVSCNEKGTNPEEEPASFSFYSGKCNGDLQKESAAPDSSFEYTFSDNLLIDFSVPGNCCPDSNRFTVSRNISHDTIYISVEDTAEHLCLCSCNYHIYAQINDLPDDHYIVLCTLKGAYNNPLYVIDVYRGHGLTRKNQHKAEKG